MKNHFIILLVSVIALGYAELKLSNSNASVTCATSNDKEYAVGEFCFVEYDLIPLTCYLYGNATLGAENFGCKGKCGESENTVRIMCFTDLCNLDNKIIKANAEDGMPVCVGGMQKFNDDCKKEILVSLANKQKTTTTAPNVVSP